MQRVTPDRRWPLFDAASTRAIEQAAAAALPPHALMQRAGLAAARLAMALAPHAQTIWLACGPGNNGGDGFEAAFHLKQWGKRPVVSWAGDEARVPTDALASLRRARDVGVAFVDGAPPGWDFALDAMLGLGQARPLADRLATWSDAMRAAPARVLAIDLPSGLDANTGMGAAVRAAHTLSLLTLKPGLFTGSGRDAAGSVWFDDLGVTTADRQPTAWLGGPPESAGRMHASHKGTYGDIAVIGGAPGMAGAALLAASAALHSGAGRVFASLLDTAALTVDPAQPELMLRPWDSLDHRSMAVACGCGGGDAVRAVLPKVLSTAAALVLDADALNAIATDSQLQVLVRARARRNHPTVMTPHPLEAARLLGNTTAEVQSDRLAAARELAQGFSCVVVLKGSGSVIAAPDHTPVINPTGSALLATGGTGDVLAGMIAARLAAGGDAFVAASGAVYEHGQRAGEWPSGRPLTASSLARAWTAGRARNDNRP
jgi:ADP-dependent NAD(P)H-hydrate dehydratase / NAD(P)H-hydrate epimerase